MLKTWTLIKGGQDALHKLSHTEYLEHMEEVPVL